MKNLTVLLIVSFALVACNNVSTESKSSVLDDVEETTVDSLPEGKWNGEYLKIESEDGPKRKKKSLGSEFYSMGSGHFLIDNDSIPFKLFEKKKNVLSFNNGAITALVKNAFKDGFKIVFKKDKIVNNSKDVYSVDPEGVKNKSVSMTFQTIVSDKAVALTLIKGTVELLDFNPRLANLEFNITDGVLQDEEGTTYKISGRIKMRFEQAVMTMM